MTGAIGLNTVSSARMDKPETLRLTIARQGPYTHAVAGMQVTPTCFSVCARHPNQTGCGKMFRPPTSRAGCQSYVVQRARIRPEIAIGVQSAFGHKNAWRGNIWHSVNAITISTPPSDLGGAHGDTAKPAEPCPIQILARVTP